MQGDRDDGTWCEPFAVEAHGAGCVIGSKRIAALEGVLHAPDRLARVPCPVIVEIGKHDPASLPGRGGGGGGTLLLISRGADSDRLAFLDGFTPRKLHVTEQGIHLARHAIGVGEVLKRRNGKARHDGDDRQGRHELNERDARRRLQRGSSAAAALREWIVGQRWIHGGNVRGASLREADDAPVTSGRASKMFRMRRCSQFHVAVRLCGDAHECETWPAEIALSFWSRDRSRPYRS
jgi:hypothetical protein